MERLAYDPRRPTEHVRQVAAALKRGPALVPGTGGMVALGLSARELTARFGDAYRPAVPESAFGIPEPVRRALAGPAAVRLDGFPGWSGFASAGEPLLRAVVESVPGVGIGLPDEDEVETILDEGGVPFLLAGPGPVGLGPTVFDYRTRPVQVDRKGALAILELEDRLGEPVRLGPGLLFNVLVVCTANMCRSAMAHGLLARMLEGERVFVYSAGTDAPDGSPATRSAVEAVRETGADISGHRARLLDAARVRDADLVLVMETRHRRRVLEIAPDAGTRVRLLGDYLPGAAPGREIEDPVGRPLENYRVTRDELRTALEQVARELRQRLGPQEERVVKGEEREAKGE